MEKKIKILVLLFLVLRASFSFAANPPQRQVSEFHLANGFTLFCEDVSGSQLVNFSLLIKTGSATEGTLMGSGVTHLLEHLIFKGKETERLAAVVENNGGYTNAYTTHDYTLFTATVPAESWREILPALLRSIFQPDFTPEDFSKEREVVLREISRNEDQPGYQAGRNLWNAAFLVHPYRFPIGGYPAVLSEITYADLKAYHRASYAPGNAILSVAGPIPAEEIRKVCTESSAKYKAQPAYLPAVPAEPAQVSYRERKTEFPTQLTYLYFGYHIGSLADKDTVALDVLAGVLGEGKTSRLYRALMEKNLAYSVGSAAYTPKHPGLFIVSAVCLPEKAEEVKDVIRKEIKKVGSGISRKELAEAQKRMRSSLLFGLETVEGRAADLAVNYFLTGNPLYSQTYLAEMNRVKEADVKTAAQRYLREENLTLAVVEDVPPSPTPLPSGERVGSEGCIKLKTLPNGIPLLIKEEHDLPIVSISVFLKGGLLFEEKDTAGLFPILSELLISGTKRKNSQQIAGIVNSWGGSLTPYSGNNSFGLTLSIPSEFWKDGLQLLSEILQKSVFPEKEIDRLKDEALGGIISREEDSMAKADEILRQSIFGNHPYGLPEGGARESIRRINQTIIRKTFRKFLGSNNLVITVFGNINEEKVSAETSRLFANLSPVEIGFPKPLSAEPAAGLTKKETTKKKEAALLMGFPGISVAAEERPQFNLLAGLLNSQEGILFQKLRETEPLVYSSGFGYFLGLEPGLLYFYAQCQPEKTARVREVMEEVISQLKKQAISPAELERVRARVLGSEKISRQTLFSQAQEAGLSQLYGLGYDFASKLEEKTKKVNPADLQKFAQKYFPPERKIVVIISP
ncbi:MAG: insulinase family protein [Candidatus Omnitrophica bacterium]|nr:insulinase family protein [Candidatus Omnitrophota bacterium]